MTRITVDLGHPDYKLLNRLQSKLEAASKADVVRRALRMYEQILDSDSNGWQLTYTKGKRTLPGRIL